MHRLSRRVGFIALEQPEDALALGRHLPSAGPEQLGQLVGRSHGLHVITNYCFSTIIVDIDETAARRRSVGLRVQPGRSDRERAVAGFGDG
jgi:hypothetical protein